MAEIRIGTSGWHYKHWCGPFYGKETRAPEMLPFYLQHFDTVELNNSFYRLPTGEAFRCWRESTPRNFVFAVKASRFITHNKKLKDPEEALENLLPRARQLKEKLGPVLFQLPPKWNLNLDRLEEFLAALPRKQRFTFEFRNPTWLANPVYETLRRYNAAFCIYELVGFSTPMHVTADWVYVRLHGPGEGKYQGSYSMDALERWADRIAEWAAGLKAIYVYFDNDQAGYAAQNALQLKSLVEERVPAAAA